MNIVFDLDGTLANIEHRLHHLQGEKKDWDGFHKACYEDNIEPEVVDIFGMLIDSHTLYTGYTLPKNQIEIWSGRSSISFEDTVAWLCENLELMPSDRGIEIKYSHMKRMDLKYKHFDRDKEHEWTTHVGFQMRLQGHHMSDDDLKRKWLDLARKRGFSPDLVFDDRKRVVDMWREEGVKCFQVEPGEF